MSLLDLPLCSPGAAKRVHGTEDILSDFMHISHTYKNICYYGNLSDIS